MAINQLTGICALRSSFSFTSTEVILVLPLASCYDMYSKSYSEEIWSESLFRLLKVIFLKSYHCPL